jgi:holliday junction DNA helicase RuvA
MIAFVAGTLYARRPMEAIVEVGGIGYSVLVPGSTLARLPEPGGRVHLFTHHHVREDAILLYGFSTELERDAFELMLGVSGIGPRLALAVLSAMSPAELAEHVAAGNAAVLTGIPGVGRKTADRLVLELRDRLARLDLDAAATPAERSGDRNVARNDALAALESLGLSRAQAEKNLRRVQRDHPDVTAAETLIRLALRD